VLVGGSDQRRARDRDGSIIQLMTLANMRENGIRSISATCETCQHALPSLPSRLRQRAHGGRVP
jgi:hypothetical protein